MAAVPDPAAPARRRASPANTGHGAGRRSVAATGRARRRRGTDRTGPRDGARCGRADSNPARRDGGEGWPGRAVARQQRDRVLVGERVALAADADVQPAVAGRDGADRRAGGDRRARPHGDRRERQVADPAPPAADAHHGAAAGDRAGVHHGPVARGPHAPAGRCGQVDPAMRARRERGGAGVGEGARHVAGDRPQPSLGLGGGGDRRRHQDRRHQGHGRGRDGKSGRERGGAHGTNLRPVLRRVAWVRVLVQSWCRVVADVPSRWRCEAWRGPEHRHRGGGTEGARRPREAR